MNFDQPLTLPCNHELETMVAKVSPLLFGRQVVHAWREAHWVPMVLGEQPLPGFSWQPLTSDEASEWHAYWMRLDAGAKSPLHVHPSTELLLIHEGALHDDDGAVYGPGDVVVYAAGSSHSTFSPAGCHALVVTSRHASVLRDK